MHFTAVTHLFCNWRFVPLNLLHQFLSLSHYIKYIVFFIYRNKLNWCIELNVSSKIINSLEENEIKYFGPVLGTGFFCIKEIADKWNIIKIKNFGFLNNTDEKLKITHGEKIFVNHASSKNLVSITYIELSKINNKINNNQVKKQKI